MIPLTDKQERFVHEYLIDQNASAAARRAGYSPRSASSSASELMNTPHVRERLEAALRDMLAEIKCSAMALMRERMRAAFFRARRLFKGNELRAFDELDDETYDALFISYEVRASGPIIRVRQPNREQALRALERVHERLDRLQDARCLRAGSAAPGNEMAAMEAASTATPPTGIMLDLERIKPRSVPTPAQPVTAKESAACAQPPSAAWCDAPEKDAAAGSPIADALAARPRPGEKTQVFAGSLPTQDPAQPKLSPFGEVMAAWRARKGHQNLDMGGWPGGPAL